MLTELEVRALGQQWMQEHGYSEQDTRVCCTAERCVFASHGKLFGVDRRTGEALEEVTLQHIMRTEMGWLL